MAINTYGWDGRLREFLFAVDRVFLVVIINESYGAEIIPYRYQAEAWQKDMEPLTIGTDLLFAADGAAGVPLAEMAGQTALIIAKRGWQKVPLLFLVPENETVRYAMNLPPDLSAEEQQEAAYWELDDKLIARGLNGEDFACICQPAQNHAEQCIITGVRKEYLQEVKAAFAQAELQLADLIPAAGDGYEEKSVLAYLNSSQREKMGFCKRAGTTLAFGRLLACWLALMVVICAVLTVGDIYQYHQAQITAAEQQAELAQLAGERQQMVDLTAEKTCIEKRERLWLKLERQEKSWYSLLVYLGSNITEGVCLTGINAGDERQGFQIEGQAADYDCLTEFMGRLEENSDYFSDVSLNSSTISQESPGAPAMLHFSLQINGEPEFDAKNIGKAEKS